MVRRDPLLKAAHDRGPTPARSHRHGPKTAGHFAGPGGLQRRPDRRTPRAAPTERKPSGGCAAGGSPSASRLYAGCRSGGPRRRPRPGRPARWLGGGSCWQTPATARCPAAMRAKAVAVGRPDSGPPPAHCRGGMPRAHQPASAGPVRRAALGLPAPLAGTWTLSLGDGAQAGKLRLRLEAPIDGGSLQCDIASPNFRMPQAPLGGV